jgi:hypothetical protein
LALGVALAWLPLGTCAGEAHKGKPLPLIDRRADRIMRDMNDDLAMAEAFRFHADITFDDVTKTGQKIQYAASLEVAVQRPNKLYAEFVGDTASRRFWYDGNSVTLLDPTSKLVATITAAGTIDATLDKLRTDRGVLLPLSELTRSAPYAAVRRDVVRGSYIGQHRAGGVRCHHLAFQGERTDCQIWVEDGEHTVPRKVVITYRTAPCWPQYTAVLSRWEFTPRHDHRQFSPDIPEPVTRIELKDIKPVVRGESAFPLGPPVGSTLKTLPTGAKEVLVDGTRYHVQAGTYYQEYCCDAQAIYLVVRDPSQTPSLR